MSTEPLRDGSHPAPVPAAASLPVSEVLEALDASPAGLGQAEAERRLQVYGPNALVSRRRTTLLSIVAGQLRNPVALLLAGAAVFAVAFGEIEEAIAVAIVLVLNSLIGIVTEVRAVRSMEALRVLGTQSARVRRDGELRVLPAQALVPGDIVAFEAGDAIAADLRLITPARVVADESLLTGESVGVEKTPAPVQPECRLADRTSMLFKGTLVTSGSGEGVVVATGAASELGRISRLVETAEPERSPLERQLSRLSGQLIWATLVIAGAIALVGFATGRDLLLMVEAAIALAVAAIPEGLPIVATLTLARGMLRMARRNALIERLPAVETLGATTVILTDKTGTLTENRMTVRRVWTADGEADLEMPLADSEALPLRRLLVAAALCGTAELGADGERGSGDPMELALLRLGRRMGVERDDLLGRLPLVRVHPFEAAVRMMATIHRKADGSFLYLAKGAPEAILERARTLLTAEGLVPLDEAARTGWRRQADEYARLGLRLLVCASKTEARPDAPPFEDLCLLGLVGIEDPARADVPDAIAACHESGIRVVMVTGDHAGTAKSIGRAVGLGADGARVAEGREVCEMVANGGNGLFETGIFARVEPAEKLDLVRAYQARGDVVAMTGDGVNDAPALRQADIGIAMGLRGSDVARQAAAMVLLDDAFPTIVHAIREGRVIFANIRRVAAYLLSCNLSEVLVVGIAVLTGLPLPVLPLQILYLNLVTDVFPAFALAVGEGEKDVMRRPPRDPRQPILGRPQWTQIVLQSAALSAGTFGAMLLAWLQQMSPEATTTVTFLTLAFGQLWHVFNQRDARAHPLRNQITTNRWTWLALALCALLIIVPGYLGPVGEVMGLLPPDPAMWATVFAASLAPTLLIQAVMLVLARRPAGR